MRSLLILASLLLTQILSAQDELGIAEKMFEDGDYEAVIEFVHSFEIRHPQDLLLEADAYHKLGDYSQAAETYTQALARDENNVKALMRRGAVYLELNDFGFALKDVKKALRLWPEHPEANFHMGNICYDQQDLRNAVKYYKLAIDYRPGYAKATYMLGAAKSEMGHFKDAEKAFGSVIEKIPTAKYNLAVVRLEEEKYESAIELFTDLETSGWTTYADLYFFRAEAYFYTNDKDNACKDYLKSKMLGDEEANDIYDSYCLKSKKKNARKKREVQRIAL
ncbi:MAG: tetratricopeptide repeat protein [Flavobacteriales bacterium]|nr:tetratricopeptide repeat protein [Flavobacteriales bacterium]